MASPPHVQCPSCKRTHRPPAGANCKYATAAREHCAQLAMMEEDYMLYLSDVSEEDPYEMLSEIPPVGTSEFYESIKFKQIVPEERETSAMFDKKATDGATESAENQVSENIDYIDTKTEKPV